MDVAPLLRRLLDAVEIVEQILEKALAVQVYQVARSVNLGVVERPSHALAVSFGPTPGSLEIDQTLILRGVLCCL